MAAPNSSSDNKPDPKSGHKSDPKSGKKSDNKPNRLPFEPASSRKKVEKTPAVAGTSQPKNAKQNRAAAQPGIPEVVSRRMGRRMALFSGVPSLMGMMTFIVSYTLIQNHWLDVPPVVTLAVSLAFFGLGFVGLSYGVLSASWEEDQTGSVLGLQEFKSNWSKVTQTWRESKNSDRDP